MGGIRFWVSGAAATLAAALAGAEEPASGEQLYLRHCAACHQADGSGSPDFAPALVGSAVLNASFEGVVAYLEAGADSGDFINKMPSFARLDAQVLARIARFSRDAFAESAQAEPVARPKAATAQ